MIQNPRPSGQREPWRSRGVIWAAITRHGIVWPRRNCDMTISPNGGLVPAERRLAEIHDRYGPGHLVSRSIRRATPMILGAVEQVQDKAAGTVSFDK